MTGAATRSGGCMCGAVRFEARDVPREVTACHCEMCRRWTGAALLVVQTAPEAVVWQGLDHIARRQTSEWAERAWCAECGSGLWYRWLAGAGRPGHVSIPLGLFDAPDGFSLRKEIFIDHKPDAFAFADTGQRRLTRAECMAQFR